jgi:hypothetical protein
MRVGDIAVGVHVINEWAPVEAWHVDTGAPREIPAASTWRISAYEDGQVCIATSSFGSHFDVWMDAVDFLADFDVTNATEH